MTVEMKLLVHLEYIVMPEGVPLNAKQVMALCDMSTVGQRFEAYKRSLKHGPLLLAEEDDDRILRWVNEGKQSKPCETFILSTRLES